MIVSFAGQKGKQVASLAEASALYCAARDRGVGRGASKFRPGEIHENGVLIARISYNGKVWPAEDWHPGQVPLLDIYAEA
jgi:hypothetical protein